MRGNRMCRTEDEQQGISVRRGTGHCLRRQHAGGAGLVHHNDGLSKCATHRGSKTPQDSIRCTSRWLRTNDSDCFAIAPSLRELLTLSGSARPKTQS